MNSVQYLVPDDARSRHIYIAGKSQSGKSTLILRMALQDIDQGKGVCVIDPHGDLVEKMIHYIPKHRADDTIYLDATEPIPIDFMGYEDERERDTLADDILVLFMRFSQTWGERMDAILRHTIYTILEAKSCTFLDIYYMLANKRYRDMILERVANPDLQYYWEHQYPHLPKDAASPITSRMAKFLLTPSLRTILGSANPKLNLYDVMEKKQVLLVNLAKVGQESGNLLGTLLVSKIQQATMRRQYQKKEERIPFYLYVDEFQHFQTSAFDVILSEAGKYKLCLALAHQYVDQLNAEIRNSIFGNVSSFILFRLNERDALCFRGELGKDGAGEPFYEKLTRLQTGQAIYRDVTGATHLVPTYPPPNYSHASSAEIIRKRTIEQYSCSPPPAPEIIDHGDDEKHREPSPTEPQPTGRPKGVPSHRSKT